MSQDDFSVEASSNDSDQTSPAFPSYRDLLKRTDRPAGTSWDLWGADDELGTVNHITPERVRAASALVRTGERFSLDHTLDAFSPSPAKHRKPYVHHIFGTDENHRDDYLDSLYMQGTSQIDGLRHFAHPDHGFYNGFDPELLQQRQPTLGIQRLAEHGIVARGVVVDVDAYLRSQGSALDHATGEIISVDTVKAAAHAQNVEFRPGDILLIRTGWANYYLNELSVKDRAERGPSRMTGLESSYETVEWLWDMQFSVIASDTFAVETWPAAPDSPFLTDAELAGKPRVLQSGMMHRILIPMLGMSLGELWNLDTLAEACARDGVWECMVVATPLKLVGGVGSPSNAVAIR